MGFSTRVGRIAARVLACCVAGMPAGVIAAKAEAEIDEQAVKLADVNVVVWSGKARASEKQPVIVFSHGFHGCATQSRFLMRAFAAAGYLVFAPNHRDATCGEGAARWSESAAQPLREPEKWTDASYRDRADDVRSLVDAIGHDARFAARADLSRLGLAGHSLGGYAVLGLAGAWPSWKLPDVKAVLALSPYSQPFVASDTLSGLAAPVMYQGGTLDMGITPTPHKSMGSYDRSPSPKYYIELDGAGHFAWTNLRATFHDTIATYSVAFMDRYVKGAQSGSELAQKRRDVAIFRASPGG